MTRSSLLAENLTDALNVLLYSGLMKEEILDGRTYYSITDLGESVLKRHGYPKNKHNA